MIKFTPLYISLSIWLSRLAKLYVGELVHDTTGGIGMLSTLFDLYLINKYGLRD